MTSFTHEKHNPKTLKIVKEVKDEDIQGLITSIREQGLFHEPSIKDNLEVIAGAKRVRAVQILDIPEIDVKVYPSNLKAEQYQIISAHENLFRKNLAWYEQCVQEKELHELHIKVYGQADSKRKDRGGSGWSLRDTASELNISFGGLSQDIRLAEAFLLDPSLAKIQDKRTALKVISQKISLAAQESIAVSNTNTSDIHLGSSEEVLKAYDKETFDACITDPPWLEYRDKGLIKDEFTDKVFKEVYRTLKQNSFLFAFVGTLDFGTYQSVLEQIGFKVQKWPMIWVKENSLSFGTTTWQTQRNFEQIILAVKGTPALLDKMVSSIITCPIVPSAKMLHPNEKPIEVLKKLLLFSTFENSFVLDPFGGSGSTGEACKLLKRNYVIIEKNPEFCSKIKSRLEKETK